MWDDQDDCNHTRDNSDGSRADDTWEDQTIHRHIHNRAGIQNRLHVPEDLLHLPEFLVLEGHLLGTEIRIGQEHPFAVKAALPFDLIFIDADAVFLYREVFSIPFIANKTFRIRFDLLFQGINDGLTIQGILAGLFRIEAHDVALAP